MSSEFVVVLYWLFYLNMRFSSGKLSLFSGIWWINASPGAETTREENRVRRIHNFFYLLQSKSKQIWILFTCFGIFANTIYSHHSLKKFTKIHIQILDLMQNKYMLKRIFASEQILASIFSYLRIFTSKYLFWSEYSQNLEKFPLKWIFACKFLHTSKYLLCIASIFTSLRPQFNIWFFLKIFASLRFNFLL